MDVGNSFRSPAIHADADGERSLGGLALGGVGPADQADRTSRFLLSKLPPFPIFSPLRPKHPTASPVRPALASSRLILRYPPGYVSIAKASTRYLLSTDPGTSPARLPCSRSGGLNSASLDVLHAPPLDGGREESSRYLKSEANTPNGLFACWLMPCVVFSADS